jgi:transcriptional regulator with XRE-family HTH domain
MIDKKVFERLSTNLAASLTYLREKKGFTQSALAEVAGIPRSTLANLEAGSGNPTLEVLYRVATGLNVPIEEIISAPTAKCEVYKKEDLITKGGRRGITINKLLPDPIPGMEIDRITLKPSKKINGSPHRSGTREYLYCEKGSLTLWVEGEKYKLNQGDLATFSGDQKHSYHNHGSQECTAFSVVALPPMKI